MLTDQSVDSLGSSLARSATAQAAEGASLQVGKELTGRRSRRCLASTVLAEFEPLRQITGGLRSILSCDAQADAGPARGWLTMAAGLVAAAVFGFGVTGRCDLKSEPDRRPGVEELRLTPPADHGNRSVYVSPESG
ncbi:hypothetical protein [Streptomyces bluensis]|uniref:hypothetical protein n=1 Tax=Streptomyces bluensis TaxID=33897 RepID=UPI00199FC767|nr:hypothetical protein GCM10010344_39020 [Streptomyces bluensis]